MSSWLRKRGDQRSYQVVLLVVHLGRVSPHAVDRQQQVHERKRGVEPQQVGPGKHQTSLFSAERFHGHKPNASNPVVWF